MPRSTRCSAAIGLFVVALLTTSQASAQDGKAPDYQAIVAAPDRSDADRQTDQRREPAKMLAFTGVKEGMKVLDMDANAGYSTELLARAVGPTGKVYAQDPASIIELHVKDKFDNRAKSPAMKNVEHVIRNFDDPIPPDVSGLDLITFFFAYHDVTYMPVDRAKMNEKMFAALKPGGFLVIADHSAKPGAGTTVAKTLQRLVRDGFVTYRPYRSIFLTEQGKDLAQSARERHHLVLRFLEWLGLPAQVCEQDAEGMEHHLSEETLCALRARLDQVAPEFGVR